MRNLNCSPIKLSWIDSLDDLVGRPKLPNLRCKPGQIQVRLISHVVRHIARESIGPAEPLISLSQRTPAEPPGADEIAQPQKRLCVALRLEPDQRISQVPDFAVDKIEPGGILGRTLDYRS